MTVTIVCPTCGSRLCDADSQVIVRTKITRNKINKKCPADYYIKCWKCKTTIGIKKD